jgi:hypothetical protein
MRSHIANYLKFVHEFSLLEPINSLLNLTILIIMKILQHII